MQNMQHRAPFTIQVHFDPNNKRWATLNMPSVGQQVSVIAEIEDHRSGSYLLVSPFIYNGTDPRVMLRTPSQSVSGSQQTPTTTTGDITDIPVISRMKAEPESPTPGAANLDTGNEELKDCDDGELEIVVGAEEGAQGDAAKQKPNKRVKREGKSKGKK